MSTRKQVALIGGIANGLARGVSLSSMLLAIANAAQQPAQPMSEGDHDRLAAARAKQERKAAKKAAQRIQSSSTP